MANGIYGKALSGYAFPNVLTDNIKVALVRIGVGHYQVAINTDQFLSSIAGADIYGTSPNLGTKTFVNGLFDAADFTYGVLAASPACGALVIYHDTGVAATSELLVYIDTGYTGLPVTPDGVGAVPVTWPGSGIFQI